jgi:hypothetical protein
VFACTKRATGTTMYDLGTSKHDLGTSKYDLGTSKYDLGTSKYDLGTDCYSLKEKTRRGETHAGYCVRSTPHQKVKFLKMALSADQLHGLFEKGRANFDAKLASARATLDEPEVLRMLNKVTTSKTIRADTFHDMKALYYLT